jgi:hypothetical protein
MMNRADGDTDIPEMCNIRIQFLYTEIDTFPGQGIHHGCVFNYTWRDESDKVIEDTPTLRYREPRRGYRRYDPIESDEQREQASPGAPVSYRRRCTGSTGCPPRYGIPQVQPSIRNARWIFFTTRYARTLKQMAATVIKNGIKK